MEIFLQEAANTAGIVSHSDKQKNALQLSCNILVVPDVRTFMEQENIPSAQVIYFDTYEEALKFREELSVESQK